MYTYIFYISESTRVMAGLFSNPKSAYIHYCLFSSTYPICIAFIDFWYHFHFHSLYICWSESAQINHNRFISIYLSIYLRMDTSIYLYIYIYIYIFVCVCACVCLCECVCVSLSISLSLSLSLCLYTCLLIAMSFL